MQIRITPFTVGFGGREERGYILYPSPDPGTGPAYLVLDKDGDLLFVEGGEDELRDPINCPDERWYVAALRDVAHAAWCADCGEPLEEWPFDGVYALEVAENMGWVARYGPAADEVILPDTPVFFPGGLPADLREQAGGDVRRAMRLLADCVRQEVAEPLLPGSTAPAEGVVVTAAGLAAVTV